MFVYNRCTTDARVLKEARSFVEAGHEVEIVAVLDATTSPVEEREGFLIRRVDRRPLHYRLLWRIRAGRRRLRLGLARARAAIRRPGRRVRRRLRLQRNVTRRRLARLRRRQSARRRRLRRRTSWLRRRWRYLRLRIRRLTARPRRVAWGIVRRNAARLWQAAAGQVRTPASAGDFAPPGLDRGRAGVWAIPSVAAAQVLAAWRRVRLQVLRVVGLLVLPFVVVLTVARAAAALVRRAVAAPLRWTRVLERVLYRSLMYFHKPLMFIDYWGRAYRMVRRRRADAYHAHDVLTLPVAAALARSTGARLVYDAHELYPEISTLSPTERRMWSLIERSLIHLPDAVVTVCDSIADELVQRYRIRRPVIVLNCPVAENGDGDAAASRPLPRLRSGDDQPVVLYQGGFAPFRGLETLIRAAAMLEQGRVVLMGWGVIEDDLRALIAERGVEGRVVIVPPVPQRDVVAVARQADVGVIPYEPVGLNNTFTTPNKLFDYMAAGLPIVGSRLPELRRFIEGHEMGLTFTAGDEEDLARELNRLLGDPDLRARMAANAARASTRYVWQQESKKLFAAHHLDGGSAPTEVSSHT